MTQSDPAIPFERIRGWLFDLDGTLMDTDDQTVEGRARRLRLLGEPHAHRAARRIVMAAETPLNGLVTIADFLHLDSVLFALRRRLSGQAHPTFRLMAGVTPLLAALRSRGALAIVSTRSRDAAESFLRQHSLSGYFDLCVTQESTKRLKPHPAPILYAAARLGLSPEECVMVGDTTVDIRSARRAGAWAVGVLCGFGGEAELRRSGAHLVLRTTADLLPLVQASTLPRP